MGGTDGLANEHRYLKMRNPNLIAQNKQGDRREASVLPSGRGQTSHESALAEDLQPSPSSRASLHSLLNAAQRQWASPGVGQSIFSYNAHSSTLVSHNIVTSAYAQ